MKLDQKKKINRLLIYFFYDADGIVDRYVPYILKDLRKNCSEIFVICNGKLTPEGRAAFEEIADNVMVRENKGFDVWAYKTALEFYGWDKLAGYDEVIMMNHTIMGPVYPFSEMFEEMNKRDLDFWGITAFHKVPFDPYGTISFGYIPWHLQSSFIAVRKTILKSVDFRAYWESRPPITNYSEAVGMHEAIFTKTFQDHGFVCESYVDTTDLEKFTNHPIMKAPVEIIKNRRCPVFKRRSFFHSYDDFINETNGDQSRQLLEFLQDETDYDVDMIWENILRTSNIADIKNNLHLEYILSDRSVDKEPPRCKIALVIHIYFEELIEYCYKYAMSMPESAEIILTTDTEEKKKKIKKLFLNGKFKNVHVVLVENRGRDVSALLVGAAPYIRDVDLACFVHDKKVTQLPYLLTGRSFSDRCFENCLATPEYVQNVVNTMMENKRLGLLCPPPPNFSDYYSTTGWEWGPNFEITKAWAETLGIKAVIEREKEPVAPLGTMFWFKPKALAPLFDYDWKDDDFPEEPNKTDGTILHAIERLYSYSAQSQGYYTGWCMTIPQAQLEWNNLYYMLRKVNVDLFRLYGPQSGWMMHCILVNSYSIVNNTEQDKEAVRKQKRLRKKQTLKSKIPVPIWNCMKKIYHFFGGKKWVG